MISLVSRRIVRSVMRRYWLDRASGELPIPIKRIAEAEGWIVAFSDDIDPYRGYSLWNGDRRFMRIHSGYDWPEQRWSIGHEFAHWINGDASAIHFRCDDPVEPDLDGDRERRADLVAAELLIPDWILQRERDPQAIADRCIVPVELARLRLTAWSHRR